MRGLGCTDGSEGFWQSIPIKEANLLDRAGHTASVVGRFIFIIGGRKK